MRSGGARVALHVCGGRERPVAAAWLGRRVRQTSALLPPLQCREEKMHAEQSRGGRRRGGGGGGPSMGGMFGAGGQSGARVVFMGPFGPMGVSFGANSGSCVGPGAYGPPPGAYGPPPSAYGPPPSHRRDYGRRRASRRVQSAAPVPVAARHAPPLRVPRPLSTPCLSRRAALARCPLCHSLQRARARARASGRMRMMRTIWSGMRPSRSDCSCESHGGEPRSLSQPALHRERAAMQRAPGHALHTH